MKKPNIILLLLMVLACLAACHKDKEMDVKEAVVSNEEMTVTETQARFSWQVDFAGQFQTGVEVSQSENMADLRRVEASKEEDKFVAVVDSLTEGTNYYYRFVVWNKFGSSEQSVGNFKTMETPPTPGQDTTYFEITVSVNLPEGGTTTGGGHFAEGDTCRVMATANTGYIFVNWTENESQVSTDSVYAFAVTGNRDLVANFREEDAVLYTVITKAEPEVGGIVTGGGIYEEGREIELKATANTGYTFIQWNDGSTDNPRTVTVTADVTYTAYFNHDEYEIKVECQPENGGTATGGGMFHYGDTIALSATPNANFNFEGWSDGSTDNPYEVVVTGNATYKAVFSEAGAVYYNVATHVYPGDYAGTVTGGGPHPEGSQIQLLANANTEAGYLFEKWDDGNTDNPRTITVNSDMEFTAFFKKKTYTVTVQAGTGGTVHIGDLTGTIEATFEHGESCMVHAIPETGYSFVNWTENGTEASTDENYSFIVTSNHNLVANFQQQQYWIGTSVDPTNSGTVSGGNRYYNHGEQCNLTATANEQYEFDHWTKNGSSYPGGSTITFTVTEAASYTAHFRLRQYTISVSASTGGSAHVGSATGPTTGTYNQGQSCTVYAVANSNYTFANWTEGGSVVSTQANYTFTVNSNRTLVANFTYVPPTYTITVSANPSNGGSVSGGGQYQQGQTCTLTATNNPGFTFDHWTRNGTTLSGGATISFTVTSNATYVAYFISNTGGHEYVDLGLPSGLLWATCNIGADSPEDYGYYFAWGETEPKSDYSWGTYQYCNGSSNTLTKYCTNASDGYNGFTDNLTVLEASDDAATAQWGSGWRMPTQAEWQELLSNTTNVWTTQNGVNGRLFTATNGNSLFLPAAGFRSGASLDGAGTYGYYWSSSLHTDRPYRAWGLLFNSGGCGMYSNGRGCGQSVRPVRSASKI